MENQYNYYKPENDINETTNNYNYSYEPEGEKKPKKEKRKTPGWVKAVCFGLVFGLVGGLTFTGTSYVSGKLLGVKQGTQNKNNDIGTAKLTSGNSVTATSDVTEIAENVMPSIVSITNMSVKQVQDFFGGIREQESESAGTGIIVAKNDNELLMVTNNHVVEGSQTLTVTFCDGESYEAAVKGTDANRDVAVVSIKLSKISDSTKAAIKVAQMGDSSTIKVGEQVVAIGNALGYGQSVTTGIVSAADRTWDGIDGKLIQTDAAINPGNSGGALVNMQGQVIGINSAKVAVDTVEGMGYAIPVSDVSDIIQNLMNRQTREKVAEADQGKIGISGVDVSADSAKMYNMPTGVYVSEVLKGGGAEKAGMEKGCIITKFDGTSISGMDTLKEQLQYYRIGEKVKLTVEVPQNNGEYKEKTVEVTLGNGK